jgi:hypothetical protein
MPRGGPRPGAGAPIGNINALRHGRYSPRLLALLRIPLISELLLRHLPRRERPRARLAIERLLQEQSNTRPPVQSATAPKRRKSSRQSNSPPTQPSPL